MSIRDRLFTRDLAHAAAERRERLRDEDGHRDHHAAATIADAPAATLGDEARRRDERDAVIREERLDAPPLPVDAAPAGAAISGAADRAPSTAEPHCIFPGDEAGGFRSRWEAIQTGFVDEPRAAVEQADALVAQVMTRLAEVFSEEREQLEHQWDTGDSISTEDLRIALKRYRSFFDRLLSV